MILRLEPSIPVNVTSKNNEYGRAIGWIDYSENHSLIWIVAMNDSREIWLVKNEDILMAVNWTMNY